MEHARENIQIVRLSKILKLSTLNLKNYLLVNCYIFDLCSENVKIEYRNDNSLYTFMMSLNAKALLSPARDQIDMKRNFGFHPFSLF